MSLQQGVLESYDFERMIVKFTMLDKDKTILCGITMGPWTTLKATVTRITSAHGSVYEVACGN